MAAPPPLAEGEVVPAAPRNHCPTWRSFVSLSRLSFVHASHSLPLNLASFSVAKDKVARRARRRLSRGDNQSGTRENPRKQYRRTSQSGDLSWSGTSREQLSLRMERGWTAAVRKVLDLPRLSWNFGAPDDDERTGVICVTRSGNGR